MVTENGASKKEILIRINMATAEIIIRFGNIEKFNSILRTSSTNR